MAAPAANSAGPGRRGAQALSAPRAKPAANACSDVITVSNGCISSFANPFKEEYVCATFLGRYPDVNTTRLQSTARIALIGAACLALRCFAIPDTETDLVAAVSARVSDDYVRKSQADGRPQDEFYAFGEGGHWTGASKDASIDGLRFIDVARTIAGPLSDQNYLPTRDPKATKLLILVYWGKTRTPGSLDESEATRDLASADSLLASAKSSQAQKLISNAVIPVSTGTLMQCGHIESTVDYEQQVDRAQSEGSDSGALAVVSAENNSRDQLVAQNAMMLGFDGALRETVGLVGTPLEHRRTDLVQELEQGRYFVVLMAYDFQLVWKQKKHKLLWETRYSVPERGKRFDGYLLAMTQRASRYFGKNSSGLVRMDLPEGHVEVGDVKSLGVINPDR